MELFEWFQALNVNGLSLTDLKREGSILSAYVILSLFLRKSVFLLAFFMCFLLVNAKAAQAIQEYQVYMITIVIYSYVYQHCKTMFSKYSCVTIMFLSLIFAVDAFLYGANGYYGEDTTLVYQSIGNLALLAHTVFICSLINYKRVQHHLLGFFAHIVRVKAYCYNL
jgi:hypothetical protein